MNVYPYRTAGGKDLIMAYIDSLSKDEIVDALSVLKAMEDDRMEELNISHWRGKIYEAYFYKHNRIFYIAIENKDIYLLHACRKQKNETEQTDSEKVIKRAKELGSKLSMNFI